MIDALISHVLTHYDLGPLQSVTPLDDGRVNDTVRVDTTHGSFVLRQNCPQARLTAIRYRHRLMDWVRQAGVPVPAVVATRDGASFVAVERYIYEIQTYLEGQRHSPGNREEARAAGEVIARYHTAVAGAPDPPWPAECRYCPQRIRSMVEQFVERDPFGDLADLLAWYDRRAAALAKVLPPALIGRLPQTTIHGDIHEANILFRDGRVSALLDFDQVVRGPRLTDVVDALIAFASVENRELVSLWGPYRGFPDEGCVAALLAAYHQHATFTADEVGALPAMLECAWLTGELGRLYETSGGGSTFRRAVLSQGRVLAGWLERQGGKLFGGSGAPCFTLPRAA